MKTTKAYLLQDIVIHTKDKTVTLSKGTIVLIHYTEGDLFASYGTLAFTLTKEEYVPILDILDTVNCLSELH